MTVLLNREAPFENFSLDSRQIASRTSFCRVRYFHYNYQNLKEATTINPNALTDSQVFETTEDLIFEQEIDSVTVSKSINSASSRFNITVFPSKNWRQIISPGDWVIIYFYPSIENLQRNEKNRLKNLVLLGNIDRVSRVIDKNEDTDKTRLRYSISGRGFGKCFEQTEIWYDPHATNQVIEDNLLRTAGLEILGSPSTLVQKIYDIFLGGGSNVLSAVVDNKGGASKNEVRTKPLKQWRIPSSLANFIGVTTNTISSNEPIIYDLIQNKIEKNLPGFKTRAMLNIDASQSVWDYMTQNANMQVNELFIEESRNAFGEARPTIVLRPRPVQTPFFDQQYGKEIKYREFLKGAYKSLQALAKESFVEISQAEIKYEDLGRDEHSRINMFYCGVRSNLDYTLSRAATSGHPAISNPFINLNSIRRNGLKKYDQILEFCEIPEENSKQLPIIDLFRAFVVQLYDLHAYNHLYDAGTIECTGVLEAELGKVLKIKAQAGSNLDKIYYIEGYEHKWRFPSTWTTTFTVTHGQFETNKNPWIDLASFDLGTADNEILNTYIAKTITEKDI